MRSNRAGIGTPSSRAAVEWLKNADEGSRTA